MAFEIATELASSAPAAALNSASRPSSAAPVAAAARMTCSPSSELSATRRLAAGVADAAVMDVSPPDIGPAIDCAQPVASTTTPATVQTDFTIVDVSIVLILLGWLESVHADLAAHRGVTLAEVRVHPGGSELHGRGRSPALEALGEAAVALCRSTGGHRVRDVVPVGPRHARAGLDVDLTRPELEDPHGYLRLRRRRRGDAGTCENRCEKPGTAQDVPRLHRCPSCTRSTGRFGLWIGLLPSGSVAARWFLLASRRLRNAGNLAALAEPRRGLRPYPPGGGADRAALAPARGSRSRRAGGRYAERRGAQRLVLGAAPADPHLLRVRPDPRDGAGGGPELPAALHRPGAWLRHDRRWISRRVLSGWRRGLAPGPWGRERSLARRPAIGVAGAHRRHRRRDVRRLCLPVRHGAARQRARWSS